MKNPIFLILFFISFDLFSQSANDWEKTLNDLIENKKNAKNCATLTSGEELTKNDTIKVVNQKLIVFYDDELEQFCEKHFEYRKEICIYIIEKKLPVKEYFWISNLILYRLTLFDASSLKFVLKGPSQKWIDNSFEEKINSWNEYLKLYPNGSPMKRTIKK